MRLLHLHWPNLLINLAAIRLGGSPSAPSASFPAGPVVLGGPPWGDGVVLDADPLARALGIRRGMALGAAHRLAPEATFLDPMACHGAVGLRQKVRRLPPAAVLGEGATRMEMTPTGWVRWRWHHITQSNHRPNTVRIGLWHRREQRLCIRMGRRVHHF